MPAKHRFLPLLLFITLGCTLNWADDDSRYRNTLELFRSFPEVQPYFADAYGYAVFPTIGKGGIGIGGAYGEGRVYRNGTVTGTVSLAQLSIGFQLGGQAFSEIIFFKDKRAYEEFTDGSFEFGGDASVVAITAGAQAKVSTSGNTASASAGPKTGKQLGAEYVKGMAVFVHAKGGLMYEASIGGQKFSFKPEK